MTIYGWDASHYDWDRGPMDIAAAVKDGIAFMTHKVGEGRTFTDNRLDDFWRRARAAQMPLLGGYYVNHPGDQAYQADRFLSLLDSNAPGWRDGPFILQVDAEKFDYMDRAPNRAECKAFCDRLVSRTGGAYRPILYAPKWVYGNALTGVGYPLWASNYGTNPVQHYRTAYPGDNSSRWAAYSGQTPVLLQYGSRTRIGNQSTCDVNAYRGTLVQLRALVYLEGEEDMSAQAETDIAAIKAALMTPVSWYPRGAGKPGFTTVQMIHNLAWALLLGKEGVETTWIHHVLAAIAARAGMTSAELEQVTAAAREGAAAGVAAAAADVVDEAELARQVLAGLGARSAGDVAAALRAVMSPEQIAALAAELAA